MPKTQVEFKKKECFKIMRRDTMKSEKCRQDKLWEIDPDYRRYLHDHHPEAIEFVKKNADSIKHKNNIWLDIRNYDTFSDLTPDGSFLPGTRNVILFKRIAFDVFPRKLQPQYIKGEDRNNCSNYAYNYNRYITWKTATEDIASQRSQGYKGEHYVVECGLNVKKSADTTRQVHIPESYIMVDNPKYQEYLSSSIYLEYQKDLTAYEEKLAAYKSFRKSFHDFVLPDGSIKKVLLYNRPDEKFAMLQELGVSKEILNDCSSRLIAPSEPVEPATPPKEIRQSIPAHYEERNVNGKWVWHHYLKSIYKK